MKYFFLVLALTSGLARAGDLEGNGGHGLRKDGALYLFDLVEGGAEKNPSFGAGDTKPYFSTELSKLFPDRPAEAALVGKKLSSLAAIDAVTAYALLEGAKLYTWSWVDAALVPIDDVGHSNLSYDAADLVQLAARSGSTILINKTAYEELDDNNRAALLLHEAVYLLLREHFDSSLGRPNQNGELARKINAYLLSAALENRGAAGLYAVAGIEIPSLNPYFSFWNIHDDSAHAAANSVEVPTEGLGAGRELWAAPRLTIETPERVWTVFLQAPAAAFSQVAQEVCAARPAHADLAREHTPLRLSFNSVANGSNMTWAFLSEENDPRRKILTVRTLKTDCLGQMSQAISQLLQF